MNSSMSPEDITAEQALRPTSLQEFVGQQRVKDQVDLLLRAARERRTPSDHILLSGPPGIGKTSACRIICKHLGYEVLEMNASDCRSKLAITNSISTLSNNKSIDYWTMAGKAKQEQNALNPLI